LPVHHSFSFKRHPTRNTVLFLQLINITLGKMYAARTVKPKLSLSISAAQNSRPSLSLKSPGPSSIRTLTPVSPVSPTARTSQREYSALAPVTYAYKNSSTSKSILKKHQSSRSGMSKKIQFDNSPTVYCVTPIENKEDYYGGYVKISRDERRWGLRS